MSDQRINLAALRDWAEAEHVTLGRSEKQKQILALVEAVEAAQALLDDLDDAIAGADLDTWDAPYRIEAPLFRESADRLRDTLRPLDFGERP